MTTLGSAVIPPTIWPEAAPSIHEEKIISIAIGNTHISWAIHEGIKNKLTPTLFWRTPHLDPAEMTGDPCEVLATHIPDQAHALLFGSKSADATKKSAIRAATLRRVSVLSVYIVSTNAQQLENFCQLWSGVPTRMYLMQPDDFFTQQHGRYEGMGVDRLASLRAAGDFHGFPALVFDGGTAATYTAADANGNILGGGIGPGVQAKLRSLSDYASALPHIKYEQLRAEIAGLTDENGNSKKTLPVFARSTKQNIITRLCREIACEGHAVIQHFLQVVGPTTTNPDPAEASPASRPNPPTVICTGGDADLIARLLAPDYSKLLRMEPGKQTPQMYSVKKMKQMVHYGIQGVLKRHMELAAKDALRDEENILFGQRLAKRFSIRDDDGDPIFRGTVTAVHRDNGKYPYYVRYDDGDGEDMTAVDLYEALELYLKVGEKGQSTMPLSHDAQKLPTGQKIDLALAAANTLAKNDLVMAAIEKKKRKDPPRLSTEAAKAPAPAAPAQTAASLKRSPAPEETVSKKAKKGLVKSKEEYKGDRIAKKFDKDIFFGTIRGFWVDDEDGKAYWDVTYDDDDMEDFSENELVEALNLYSKHKAKDAMAKS